MPAEMKRDLTRLRDLDTHSQEIFERMQKQSKNHIARAKRSVQSGAQLDDELLLKVLPIRPKLPPPRHTPQRSQHPHRLHTIVCARRAC